MNLNLKKGTGYHILWRDTVSFESTWMQDDELDALCPLINGIISTVGFFVKIKANYAIFSHNQNQFSNLHSSITEIPIGCIIRVTKI